MRSSVTRKLAVLVVVPLAAIIVLAGLLTYQAYSTYQNSIQTHRLMDIAVSAGNLIHSLQIERGATAGYLQSKGAKFADVLPGMRARTDEQLGKFKGNIADIHAMEVPALESILGDAQNRLDQIGEIRRKASQQALAVADEVSYYSSTIARLIDTIGVGTSFSRDAGISQEMMAYSSFVWAKENAGQERAMITAVFAANRVEPAQYRNILARINYQDAYLNLFRSLAGSEEKSRLDNVLRGTAASGVSHYRDILTNRSVEGGFGIESTEWFKTMTAKIDGLHEVENLVAEQIRADATALLAASRSELMLVLTMSLFVICATIVVSFRVARSISYPLRHMVEFTERAVSENDFAVSVPAHGAEEVVRAGSTLNLLMEKLRTVIQDVKRSSDEITRAAHALAISSDKVKENSIIQSEAAESVAAAVEQSSVSVSETASNSQAAADLVVRARNDSARAGEVMRDTVKKMEGVAQLISASGESVQRLDESSKQIGNIVQVIKEIADQTNLLALNAAIEAARAGEQGRGFAVVAGEVRQLADRTAASTGEIAALITAIQKEITGTVNTMQEANLHASTSLELVNESADALHQIDVEDEEVAMDVRNISDALSEQNAAIRQIAVNIEQIAQMTEDNNNAASTNSQTAAELDVLASELKKSVAMYKV